MNNSTAWLDCLAFEESGIKAFGCFGKRSAYLMSKEKDGYNNDEHVFEYRTDNEGYIREITVTTYDGQHQVSSKRIHTIATSTQTDSIVSSIGIIPLSSC